MQQAQYEITTPSALLNPDGTLVQQGWARHPIFRFNRENVRAAWHRIKEWDNYGIYNPKWCLVFTLGEVGYLTILGITVIDMEARKSTAWGTIRLFSRGKGTGRFLPPNTDKGNVHFRGRNFQLVFKRLEQSRIVSLNYPGFPGGGIKGTAIFSQDPQKETFVATNCDPSNPRQCYYAHKINGMPARGSFKYGRKELKFTPQDSFGMLDWYRGVNPYRTHWVWGTAAGNINGKPLEFTIGTSTNCVEEYTENAVCYDGKVHKIGLVRLSREDRPYAPWTFTSDDGAINLKLIPRVHTQGNLELLLLGSKSRISWGYFIGTITLGSGEVLRLRGRNFLGHAEEVTWRW